jgi:chromosome segregation ATPase
LNSTRIDQHGAEHRNNFCSEAAREQALALCREHEASLQGLRAQLELTRDRSSSLELQALGEQLAAAESAIKARCRERDALVTARAELQAQLTELADLEVGHRNHKQKIQHTMRIKLENDELRNENLSSPTCRAERAAPGSFAFGRSVYTLKT